MRIKISEGFRLLLSEQVLYIAEDKPKAARKFKDELIKEIRRIPTMPFSYRKSIYFEQDDIRDLIFKGYVITFRIKEEQKVIEVFGFTKYREKIEL